MKELYSENYKTLMKEIEDYIQKWKEIQYPWIGRTNIAKMFILPKAIYRFKAVPIKILMALFSELEQINLKFMWSNKKP